MKKVKILIFLQLFAFTLIAQNFDVRKVNWGMTMQEVINSEYPMRASKDGNEVEFKNVEIGNSFTARLIYSFTNGKLTELKYIVYGSEYSRGTCDKVIPLTDKVRFSTFIFDALKEKGYKCDMGWYIVNGTHLAQVTGKREDYYNCNTDFETVSFFDKVAKREGAERVAIGFENNRSHASFYFNEHQNYEPNFELPDEAKTPCKSDYYNTRFWLEITPNYKVKKEMNSSRF